jgi:protein-ribulosamine 3-kinase
MLWGDELFAFFETILFQALGEPAEVLDATLLSGGSINTAARVVSSAGLFFAKWNIAARHTDGLDDLFEAEARNLALLRRAEAVRVPTLIGTGQHNDTAWLLLECLESEPQQPHYWDTLGQQLAALHAHTNARFGLSFDNFIGTLPQPNTPDSDGIRFFFERRLLPMAGLARLKDLITSQDLDRLHRLGHRLPDLLPRERPALLHGDLWSGNLLTDDTGLPALVDPATYYGLREAEIAFTRLFGGFDERFYAAYTDTFPLEPGFAGRVPIYNLYPLLVHTNLFGSGYAAGVVNTLRRLA